MVHDPNGADNHDEDDANGRDKGSKPPARSRLARKMHKENQLDKKLKDSEDK
jgi:hypothetical protein